MGAGVAKHAKFLEKHTVADMVKEERSTALVKVLAEHDLGEALAILEEHRSKHAGSAIPPLEAAPVHLRQVFFPFLLLLLNSPLTPLPP